MSLSFSSPAHIQNYRIIKRAHSDISYESAEGCSEGPSKRQKTRDDDVSHAKPRVYAHRTASLRRAESLKAIRSGTLKVRMPKWMRRDTFSDEL